MTNFLIVTILILLTLITMLFVGSQNYRRKLAYSKVKHRLDIAAETRRKSL